LENFTRDSLCKEIMDKLFYLEKYSIGKEKKTYLIIPSNHPKYKFPLNLEDRIEYVKKQIEDLIKQKYIKFTIKNKDNKEYNITFNYTFTKQDISKVLVFGWTSEGDKYSMVIN
jgi:hypothetical protein